jgi:Fe-S-cluster containining protein
MAAPALGLRRSVEFVDALLAMRSILYPLPVVEQWDCHGCTACCRETTIQLNAEDLARLQEQHWERHPEFHTVRTVRRSFLLGGANVLAHKADGSCVFLTNAGRCHIHEVFGAETKPLMCRQFPLQVVRTDREVVATVARSCPSAAADIGRPLNEHLSFLKQLLGYQTAHDELTRAPPVAGRARRGWDDFYLAAEAVERLLVDERLPLVRRVVHAVRFCNLLEQCKLKRVGAKEFGALVEATEQLAGADAGHLFQERKPPARRSGRLFRRLGGHFIRCFPGGPPARSLADHWRAMRQSGQLARSPATLPELHPCFPPMSSEKLERALGPLSGEVLRPLDRFFVTHSMSKRYALMAGGGSLVDSVRRLAFTFPISLWMLRWLASERKPEADDVVQIVVALERGLPLPALSGAARYLAHSGQLERLIAWYGR